MPNKLSRALLSFLGLFRKKQLFAAQHIVRPWPINLHEQDRGFFAKNRKYNLPASWLFHLHHVSLYWDGATFHGLHLYPETLVLPNQPTHNWRGLLAIMLRMPKYKFPAGPQYLLAHDAWAANYYHWLVDSLPRLWAVRDILPRIRLLIPYNCTTEFHKETLQALGIINVEYLEPHVRYIVPNLLVPTRLARVASYNPVVMKELRSLFLSKFTTAETINLGERIYVSRAQAIRRKVLNDNEVMDYLRDEGFAIVQLENYTFPEQVSIMANATYLLSIHGAGLTNMLFMRPGTRVLELQMRDDGTNHYYYTLAADLGIKYYYQFCQPSDPALVVQEVDLLVDIKEMKVVVKEFLE